MQEQERQSLRHTDGSQRWGMPTAGLQPAVAKHTSVLLPRQQFVLPMYYLPRVTIPQLADFPHVAHLRVKPQQGFVVFLANAFHVHLSSWLDVLNLVYVFWKVLPREGPEAGGFRAAIQVPALHADTLLCPTPSFPPLPSICSDFDKYPDSNPVIFEATAKISSDFDKFPPLSYIMYARARRSCGTSVRVLSGAFFVSFAHFFHFCAKKLKTFKSRHLTVNCAFSHTPCVQLCISLYI